jgi:serine O-acetyltransferase
MSELQSEASSPEHTATWDSIPSLMRMGGGEDKAAIKPSKTQALMRMHLLSRTMQNFHLHFLAHLIDGVIRVAFAARIPAQADIDRTVHFSHNGLAVVVTKESKIGPGCQIGTHVVLGSNWPEAGAPTLGSNVVVHCGAKILGPVTIGDGAVVAANAVVRTNIPARCLAAGVPAAIKRENLDTDRYRYPIVT